MCTGCNWRYFAGEIFLNISYIPFKSINRIIMFAKMVKVVTFSMSSQAQGKKKHLQSFHKWEQTAKLHVVKPFSYWKLLQIHVCVHYCRQLCASPFDKDLLCTCYGTVQENKSRVLCHLWRLGEEGEGEPAPLQDVTPVTHQANVRW